jgi:CheY-like chemotaxis protein
MLPPFRILIVDDDSSFTKVLCDFLTMFASAYYELEFICEENVYDGMRQLNNAVDQSHPFDVVLLDYVLPQSPGGPRKKDLSLALFCTQHAECCSWVAQLTAYPEDPELIKLWSNFNLDELSVRLLGKSDSDFLKLAKAIFFREISIPLRSAWLPAELGQVEAVIARGGHAPRGFNIYRFIRRLGDVWPSLDEESRRRAMDLFSIEPGDPMSDFPKRIGLRSFAKENKQ